MAAKIRKERTVALCFFGDGATSEDDFHAGLNFAAVYRAPVVLVCQNNQWAISTPVAAQTKAETLAAKGLAYAVPALRVDGNDVLAMYAAIRDAVNAARAGRGPTFIEAVTYRLGAHSSADDPTRYRDGSEPVVELGTLEGFPNPPAMVRGRQSRPTSHADWAKRDPLLRFGRYLASTGVLPSPAQDAARDRLRDAIRTAIAEAETAAPPPASSLVEDVFARPTWLLDEQQAELGKARVRRGSHQTTRTG